MKWISLMVIAIITIVSSCGSGNDAPTAADSANVLNDTFPARHPIDSSTADSNAANH